MVTLLPYPSPDLLPSLQPSFDDGEVLHSIGNFAASLVNKNENILKGYEIKLVKRDSGCNVNFRALYAFASAILNSSLAPIVGAVGPACSLSSRSLAPLSGRNEIAMLNVHLSHYGTQNDHTLYPYSFSSLGSLKTLANTIVLLIEQRKWTKVGIFYDDSRLTYPSLTDLINKGASERNLSIEFLQVGISPNNLAPFESIENKYRIIFLLLGTNLRKMILCIAHHRSYIPPTYQFLLTIETFDDTPTEFYFDSQFYNCSKDEMEAVLNKSIYIHYQLERADSNKVTDSGITLKEFKRVLQSLRGDTKKDIYSAILFDGIWALFMALNSSSSRANLTAYGYGQQNTTDIIQEEMFKLKFEGLSGLIEFDNITSSVKQNVILERNDTHLAFYNRSAEKLEIYHGLDLEDEFGNKIRTIPKQVAYVMLSIITLVFLLVFILNLLTCIYRDRKSVKASSVRLTQLAFISCYIFVVLLILTIVIYCFSDAIDPQIVCRIEDFHGFFTSLGLTLLFGVIFVRTWRIYRIFVHFKNPGRFLSDHALAFVVLIMVVINAGIVIIPIFIDPYRPKSIQDGNSKYNNTTLLVNLRCQRRYFELWYFGGSIIWIFQLIATVILAILSRKVRYENFKTLCVMKLSYLLSAITCVSLLFYIVFYYREGYASTVVRFCAMCIFLLSVICVPSAMLFLPPLLSKSKSK